MDRVNLSQRTRVRVAPAAAAHCTVTYSSAQLTGSSGSAQAQLSSAQLSSAQLTANSAQLSSAQLSFAHCHCSSGSAQLSSAQLRVTVRSAHRIRRATVSLLGKKAGLGRAIPTRELEPPHLSARCPPTCSAAMTRTAFLSYGVWVLQGRWGCAVSQLSLA